ncbi:ABC transporter ATP-binding protein [Ruminococcaceae bacterium OttesenSCG-928-D13]|nr:ABC transporter ATP-binding protein [Ruminococcaceae bacterium OttesenSCG-928-D13]
MSNAAAVSIQNLTKQFGGILAVDHISMEVKPGEIHGVIGPNGAGKTTLFNLITGIYTPTEGQVLVDGERITGLSPHTIANAGIARTFQNIRLFKELSCFENVVTACQNEVKYNFLQGCLRTPKYYREERRIQKKAQAILESIDLWAVHDQKSKNLPYGQQRKLEIARALAMDPKLLLLDEPAAGMNEDETNQLAGFIRQIRDQYQVTIILIEHHMDLIMEICDAIDVFNFGKKLASGTAEAIQNNPEVIEAYLGVDD